MRVEFTKINETDLDLIRIWRNSIDVKKYMYTDHEITKEEHVNWFSRIKSDTSKQYWLIKVDNKPVGVVNLSDIDTINKRCSWAYYLGEKSVRGKGIGKMIEFNIYDHVFERMKLNKLCCEVFCSNELVINIHKKYGTKIEGTFKQHIFKNGEFHDIVAMAILKEEWMENKQNFNYEKILIED